MPHDEWPTISRRPAPHSAGRSAYALNVMVEVPRGAVADAIAAGVARPASLPQNANAQQRTAGVNPMSPVARCALLGTRRPRAGRASRSRLESAPGPTNNQKDHLCHDETATRRSASSPRHSRGSHRAPGHSTPPVTPHPS